MDFLTGFLCVWVGFAAGFFCCAVLSSSKDKQAPAPHDSADTGDGR
ncbi:hypothetical protein H8K20_13350 [Neobittarella massiliensis]|uniref:Uncharacterized protein n=1 Tax=Neobittarella massiliensis (ex Bilen et al. 2018) TaxID=2041842 RepID=A0A8J6M044_9FIRM|nr:hypothetical protein [Neobittarella massiliensis]MBC3517368.1 hypothetical protein [Neobittarella massiliensis]